MNRWKHIFDDSRESRSRRPLEVSRFKPLNQEEYLILEIARVVGEQEVRYLLSIYYRYGYRVIEEAWEELRQMMAAKLPIRSHKKLLNHLIQKRIKDKPHDKNDKQ